MKTAFAFVFAAVLTATSFAALGKAQTATPQTAKPQPAVQITRLDNGQTVTATEGTDVIISLPGGIATGYAWTVTSVTGTAVKQDGNVSFADDPGPGTPGGAGIFSVHFNSATAGKSTISMVYGRSFNKRQPAVRSFSVTINVVPR
jgi:inhibitor of cysteine peptidase